VVGVHLPHAAPQPPRLVAVDGVAPVGVGVPPKTYMQVGIEHLPEDDDTNYEPMEWRRKPSRAPWPSPRMSSTPSGSDWPRGDHPPIPAGRFSVGTSSGGAAATSSFNGQCVADTVGLHRFRRGLEVGGASEEDQRVIIHLFFFSFFLSTVDFWAL
jgi:hypothetical protein